MDEERSWKQIKNGGKPLRANLRGILFAIFTPGNEAT